MQSIRGDLSGSNLLVAIATSFRKELELDMPTG